MKKILFENYIKNFILLVLFVPIYFPIKNSLVLTDPNYTGDLLIVASIIAVTACFGNFAFTYEKIKIKSRKSRMTAHVTTGLLMFIIGVSLMMVSVLTGVMTGGFLIMDLTLLALYVATILYDFWDLNRSGLE